MIKRIGFGRLLLILMLAVLLSLFIIYYYFSLVPQLDDANRELRKNNSQISQISDELDQLKSGIENFKTQEADFLALKEKHDFFNPQDRVQARRKLNVIRDISNLISAQYNIRPAIEEQNEGLADIGYKLLNTPIEFNIRAIEDKDIYTFIYNLNYSFPGLIIINEVSVTRDEDVTQPLLREIGTGQQDIRSLASARISASWRSIVADTGFSVSDEEESND